MSVAPRRSPGIFFNKTVRAVSSHARNILLTAIVVGLMVWIWWTPIMHAYENISFALDPSGARAFAYGEKHFNGRDPSAYDIHRATYFFQKAVRLDPSLLYVHHELARIYFLVGDFADAMIQIDVQIAEHGDKTPNSYYVRGLIEGYMGNYADAAKDYEHFLKFDPHNWAGINDYAWVLLKAGRAQDAETATAEGLKYLPHNPWLLNTNATALYELGDMEQAQTRAKEAWDQVQNVRTSAWLQAYPGNDPAIAGQGIETFRQAVQANMNRIKNALETRGN